MPPAKIDLNSFDLKMSKALAEAQNLSKKEIYSTRKQNFCGNMSISYENTEPLLITSADGIYLIDEDGNKYLDTRNNVAHVGHNNPEVIAAVQQQIAAINTNTRYLHPNIALLSKKILATLPEQLNTVFFVNSGSEANDLAIRLAQVHTRQREFICVNHGYHGHTTSVINISPYKFKKEKHWDKEVDEKSHIVDCPDLNFGKFKEVSEYEDQVKDICSKRDGKIAAMITESALSCGGVIMPPIGYLQNCFDMVRKSGGVCVCDEVQVGFGRFGSHFWAFQQQQVIPDIMTCGKPIGNGMPLAAVICTQEIAESFASQPEYFNTYGGNPVCAAAGLAVMYEIEQRGLQEHAKEIGRYWMGRLVELTVKFPELAKRVIGSGLFIGFRLVDARFTSYICGKMKNDKRILTSIDGPENNVLVFKPPMVIQKEHVDEVVDALQDLMENVDLEALYEGDYSHCPT